MWLMTQRGFFSIVQDPKNTSQFVVRSRSKRDLWNFCEDLGIDKKWIVETPNRDYPCRVFALKEEVGRWLAFQVGSLTYTNFKDHIHTLPDQKAKLTAYHDIWATMRKTEEKRSGKADGLSLF